MKLSIVIVNWNAEKLLRECLASLAANVKGFGIEIIVVDNASQDGSVSMVRREFPQVSLLENLENLGFAKANNQGIKKASGEYVLLLNNDAIIDNKAVLEG
ncbi:MAG: glycosyltransferase, partial [Candidatus Omnitrophica bacterium]|nr:glycosyltransferase [Candidatus Omnitrophota bacterium]